MGEVGDFAHVMTFPCVVSEGGPYDDESFVRGFEIGQLHALMGSDAMEDIDMWIPVRVELVKTADLVAMLHGYTSMTKTDSDVNGWSLMKFHKVDMEEELNRG